MCFWSFNNTAFSVCISRSTLLEQPNNNPSLSSPHARPVTRGLHAHAWFDPFLIPGLIFKCGWSGVTQIYPRIIRLVEILECGQIIFFLIWCDINPMVDDVVILAIFDIVFKWIDLCNHFFPDVTLINSRLIRPPGLILSFLLCTWLKIKLFYLNTIHPK